MAARSSAPFPPRGGKHCLTLHVDTDALAIGRAGGLHLALLAHFAATDDILRRFRHRLPVKFAYILGGLWRHA